MGPKIHSLQARPFRLTSPNNKKEEKKEYILMQMSRARKTEIKAKTAKIVETIGKSSTNTGAPEVQIALITNRINELAPHFQKNAKDHASRRGLLRLVGQRRSLLTYLKRKDEAKYNALLAQLELRK